MLFTTPIDTTDRAAALGAHYEAVTSMYVQL